MTITINTTQKTVTEYMDAAQLYTSNGMKPIIQRHCEFLRERPYGTLHGRLVPIILIATGGYIGFHTASKVAEKFNLKKEKPFLQGGGVVIGCSVGAYVYTFANEKSMFFKTWKFLKINSLTNNFIFEKHVNDEFLNQFTDCIHYTPLKVPVRLSTGHLIDLDTLKKIVPDKNGDVLCPHTREKLDLNYPKIDLEIHTLILKRCQYLLQKDLPQLDPKSDEYEATKLQLQVIESQLCVSHEMHLKGLDQLHSEGGITTSERNILKNQFFTHFGTDAIGKADPENGVDAHVMNFSLDWKKIITNHSKLIFKSTPATQFMEDV